MSEREEGDEATKTTGSTHHLIAKDVHTLLHAETITCLFPKTLFDGYPISLSIYIGSEPFFCTGPSIIRISPIPCFLSCTVLLA